MSLLSFTSQSPNYNDYLDTLTKGSKALTLV